MLGQCEERARTGSLQNIKPLQRLTIKFLVYAGYFAAGERSKLSRTKPLRSCLGVWKAGTTDKSELENKNVADWGWRHRLRIVPSSCHLGGLRLTARGTMLAEWNCATVVSCYRLGNP